MTSQDPLITSFFRAEGANTWLRQFTRLHRPVRILRAMRNTLLELVQALKEPTCVPATLGDEGRGVGLINAARGTLGHWLSVREGRITNYQVITPTTINASPRDADGRRGHWEQSFVGLRIDDLEDPVELGHVVRSHDACLVCTVHSVRTNHSWRFGMWGPADLTNVAARHLLR